MKIIVTKFIVLCVLATSFVTASCDKKTDIEKAEKFAIELRIYNKNIVLALNKAYADRKIPAEFHLNAIKAAEQFSISLDAADAAVKAVKLAADKTDKRVGLDFVERLIDVQVFGAFVKVVEAVTTFPADVKVEIEAIIASIKLTFTAIRALFAGTGYGLKEVNYA